MAKKVKPSKQTQKPKGFRIPSGNNDGQKPPTEQDPVREHQKMARP